MTALRKLTEKARVVLNGGSIYVRVSDNIDGYEVEVNIDRVMINRGMATGTADRWTYKLDGKRISAQALGKQLGGW